MRTRKNNQEIKLNDSEYGEYNDLYVHLCDENRWKNNKGKEFTRQPTYEHILLRRKEKRM